ncbi:tRNA (N(6)-L-threonylcarbamoyladenosine(37)-C(2))-methylthiotransferase [Candidatus Woesearchaeota archaeon]|nr:tRNA (N(6)-L-threonylcarbamoyladenosine(37)-C(2))-methylthiotransferase [Candidatus Woesearchaeota archaeon]
MANIYIENYGCSANRSNAEIMAGLLEKAGCIIVSDEGSADIIIINTCIVKGPTETKALKRFRETSSSGRPLIVSGCMPEAEYETVKNAAPEAILIGPQHVRDVVKAVDILLNRKKKKDFVGEQHEIKLCLPKHRYNEVIDIVQISEGCDGACAYCITRFAKGKLFSYPAEKIISEIRSAVDAGCREIWLTSQDCASYEHGLHDLLQDISQIPGRFFVRVGMMNPDKVLPMLDELIDAFKQDKIFRFLHIPVQSGNDQVLKRMNRRYSVDDFRRIIRRFRQAIPDITVSTDIICGFPGETEDQFNDSLKLIKEIKPDVMNISRFWPRPGTPAEDMGDQVHGRITKQRSCMMQELHEKVSLEKNQKWIGWKGKALVDERGKKGTGTLIARNKSYRPVVVKQKKGQDKINLGDMVDVEIEDATWFDLRT